MNSKIVLWCNTFFIKNHLNPHSPNKLGDIYSTYEENTLDQSSQTPISHHRNKYDLALNVQVTIYFSTKTCISMHRVDETFRFVYVSVSVWTYLSFESWYFSSEYLRKKKKSYISAVTFSVSETYRRPETASRQTHSHDDMRRHRNNNSSVAFKILIYCKCAVAVGTQ